MKNIKLAFILIPVFTITLTLSCEVIALGSMINLDGPTVNIIDPVVRQPVETKFFMSGTVKSVSDVADMIISAKYNNIELPIIWRYSNNVWEYYIDKPGECVWKPVPSVTLTDNSTHQSEWNGSSKNAEWKVPIDLELISDWFTLQDGQYQFAITAKDIAGNSDENSYKTRTVIVDTVPPLVTIVSPHLYDFIFLNPDINTNSDYKEMEIYKLDALAAIEANRRDMQYLGKFMNGKVKLQYQIEAVNDVWSIDIRFYKKDIQWDLKDNGTGTSNENAYVYRAWINDAANRPIAPSPEQTLKPNNWFMVPDLTGEPGKFTEDGVNHHLQYKLNPNEKTTLHVVVRCYSASGIPLDDDDMSMGSFIYWHDSDIPWLDLPATMDKTKPSVSITPGGGFDINIKYNVFPSSQVQVRSFDDDGVDYVQYEIYELGTTVAGDITETLYPKPEKYDENDERERKNVTKSRIFAFQFNPPSMTGNYKIHTEVFDINGKNEKFEGYFNVMDISQPEIREPDNINANEPLYKAIAAYIIDKEKNTNQQDALPNAWKLEITGIATAESRIGSVHMVWINPKSTNYAAMSQLAFFRDAEYGKGSTDKGWFAAPANKGNTPGNDIAFDPAAPNKVWNMNFTEMGVDQITGRRQYRYTVEINLRDHLNISPGELSRDFLKSQVFVLKASDTASPVPKAAMLTWAPQGDTEAPVIDISSVTITKSGGSITTLTPGVYVDPLDQFNTGDRITATGTWREDATSSLNIQRILDQNLKIKINDFVIDGLRNTTRTITPSGANLAGNGTWTVSGTVSRLGSDSSGNINPNPGTHTLIAESLKDTLVVTAELTDIGGSYSERTASWLMLSDELRFLRVGSENSDGIYTITDDGTTSGNPTKIDIFLEFNKPVSLKAGRSANPVLIVNTTGGVQGTATYNGSGSEFGDRANSGPNSHQHFTYEVKPGQNVEKLTLNGMTISDATFSNNDYPFTWTTINGAEEIRIVASTGKNPPAGSNYTTHILPTNNANDVYTLAAGKQIKIDTTAPLLSQTQANIPTGFYSEDSTIYVTLRFNENIKIGTGTDAPKLVFNIKNGTAITERVTTAAPIVSNNTVQFSYVVHASDTTDFNAAKTGFNPLQVTRLDGKIYDLAGNVFNNGSSPYTNPLTLTGNATTINGASVTNYFVHAIKPPAPVLKILKGSVNNAANTFATSGAAAINLNNYYEDNLYVVVEPQGTADQYSRVEISANNGEDWGVYVAPYNTPKQRTAPGEYKFTARQIDLAGNLSDSSKLITLNWDKGALLTRISSPDPNGIYTNVAGRDKIQIELSFRKKVSFTTAPEFTFMAVDKNGNKITSGVTLHPVTPNWASLSADTSFTFDYIVGAGETTANGYLAIDTMLFHDVRDEFGNDVTNMVSLAEVTSKNNNLQNNRKFEIMTGRPIANSHIFINDTTVHPTQGQQAEDDSYWTTLKINFDKGIVAGTADRVISIIQEQNGYRLPSVLTETQRARYRAAINKIAQDNSITFTGVNLSTAYIFDKYYTKGTNGFINGSGIDQATKYILSTDYNTYNITANAAGSDIEKFAEVFRQAEKIELPVNSMMVHISGQTVTVQLTSSNALKVPAANYLVTYPNGFVQDVIGLPCDAFNGTISAPKTEGTGTSLKNIVSRPFVRIKKPQEEISITPAANINANTPKFDISNWAALAEAEVIMDCRTPGSQVKYTYNAPTPAAADTSIWTWNKQDWDNRRFPTFNGSVAGSQSDPTRPTAPTNANTATNLTFTSSTTLKIGSSAATNGRYPGFRWRVYAVGFDPTRNVIGSLFTDEVAYRSAVTFVARVNGKHVLNMENGSQLWIRGGNNMNSTSIPGYPLTHGNNNWDDLQASGERAGIRLMKKLTTGPLVGSGNTDATVAIYQFVSWDINAMAYITLYKGGYDAADYAGINDATLKKRVTQYGPLKFASQIENWSFLKEFYPLFPGAQRTLDSVTPDETSSSSRGDPLSFNATVTARPNLAATGE